MLNFNQSWANKRVARWIDDILVVSVVVELWWGDHSERHAKIGLWSAVDKVGTVDNDVKYNIPYYLLSSQFQE